VIDGSAAIATSEKKYFFHTSNISIWEMLAVLSFKKPLPQFKSGSNFVFLDKSFLRTS
jgi:hypothetical protein